jgi:hypothetical protein
MPKKKFKKIDVINDYKKIFNTNSGKRVLYDLMKQGHYLHSSFTGDVNETIFREGERNIIHYIMLQLKQDPKLMLEEIRKREQEELEYEDI